MYLFRLSFYFLLAISCGCADNGTATRLPANPYSTSKNTIAYNSPVLKIIRLSPHVYQHISYLHTEDFGDVACNGAVLFDEDEAIVFDTPTDDAGALELISFIQDSLAGKIIAVVPTHFHKDCLGGLPAFHEREIPAYANQRTIDILKANRDRTFASSLIEIKDSQEFDLNGKSVKAWFLGEGHTKDNIVVYYPNDRVLFGGCLIKELNAGKGNLEDANVKDWAGTVKKVKEEFRDAKIVVPGHGEAGGKDLLDYTIQLFQ